MLIVRSLKELKNLTRKSRKNKYSAQKITLDGIVFDSKAETAWYIQLKKLQETGKIRDLEIHKVFRIGYKIKYIPDFVYFRKVLTDDGWVKEIDDVKGVLTSVFRLKQKIFEKKKKLKINIIKIDPEKADMIIKAYLGEKTRGQERVERTKKTTVLERINESCNPRTPD